MLQGYHSERRWTRHLLSSTQWRTMLFPYLLNQSGHHKRLKTAQPLPRQAILTLAACCPSWFDDMWITDAAPVPCGMSRETVTRSALAGHASFGYCAFPLVPARSIGARTAAAQSLAAVGTSPNFSQVIDASGVISGFGPSVIAP